MRSLRSTTVRLLLTLSPFALAACSGYSATTSTTQAARVSLQDHCDPASFNAALGAGTCTRQGTETFTQFNNELSSTHTVAAWRNVPATLTVRSGQVIMATNEGGVVHTFTRVAQFGGGEVPSLNSASNNPVEAPECAQISVADRIAAGASFTANTNAYSSGTVYYQCCIHPWMRTTVTVTP